MRETLDGFLSGLQIGRRIVTNLRYADDIILLATLEAELQELVDRLDRVSRKYSLFINVGKTKVIASDGIACHIRLAHFGRSSDSWRARRNCFLSSKQRTISPFPVRQILRHLNTTRRSVS